MAKPLALIEPLDWWHAPWRDRSPVLLLTGSAGGAKSMLAASKIHAACLRWPETNALITRKTAESMSRSVRMLMYETIMGGERSGIKQNKQEGYFRYPNGSIMFWAGMNDSKARERIKSIGTKGGLDMAFMEEATEFEEEDFNLITTRMRSKAMPFRQVILGTNPDSPLHWIHQRLILGGEASVYYSTARDNPHNPPDYLEALERLTGVDYERLALGRWVVATGQIIDPWSEEHNVSEAADYIPGGGTVAWAVDDGYSGAPDRKTGLYPANAHPRVILWCQIRHDGTICVFDEHHACGRIEDEHIKAALEPAYPQPEYAVVDKSAAVLKRILNDQGIGAFNGASDVEVSLKALRRAVAPDLNGRRRVLVHPRCRLLRHEMTAYSRDANGRIIKAFDHAIDALRYFVWFHRNQSETL